MRTLLLACMLCSGAFSLKCYPEENNSTTHQYEYTECAKTCARTTTRVDINLVSGISGLTFYAEDDLMSCGSPEVCVNTSINIGLVKISNHTQCCKTHICNNNTLPALVDQSINGRKCYTCNDDDCTGKLHCEGEEDRCITATVVQGARTLTLKGCTTSDICNITLFRAHGLVITDVDCCEGNYCNGAEIFTLSFLLMFIPLLSSILLY